MGFPLRITNTGWLRAKKQGPTIPRFRTGGPFAVGWNPKRAEQGATVTPRVTERARRDLPKAKAWQQGDPIREILWLYPRLREERALRRIHRRKRAMKGSKARMRRHAESMIVGM